jgi:hypothetical protein
MNKTILILFCLGLLSLLSCGGGGSSTSGNKPNTDQYNGSEMPVDWSAVSEEFHPEVFEEEFSSKDLNHIKLSILGISNEVKVTFLEGLTNTGKLKIYRVWAESGNFGRIELDASFNKLKISNYTNNQPYSCSKSIKNRKLVKVSGGCNIFVEVFLPSSAEIEVFSIDKLVSKRFFPMTFDQLLKDIRLGFSQDKMEKIELYLSSYQQSRKTPKLTSLELEKVLKEFSFADKYKYSALKELSVFVTDRENLGRVIDKTFTFSQEREEARRVVGL